MAHAAHFHDDSAQTGILARISTAVANYRLYRKTLEELHALNTRELRDLGLSPFAIRQVAYDAVYG